MGKHTNNNNNKNLFKNFNSNKSNEPTMIVFNSYTNKNISSVFWRIFFVCGSID